MATTKARTRFRNVAYRVMRSEYQLERRLKLINAFINHNLREELYLASGVEEKDKPMWKVLQTNMLLQEHAVNLEENRLLWKQWNRGNQTAGKSCSKNHVPHVCICDQNIVPKSKRKKKKGTATELPAWYKKDKETSDEDKYCCCCCKSRDNTATPVPIEDVSHDDSSSDHSGSFSFARSSNTNSFVNSKSSIVSKIGSGVSRTGTDASKAGKTSSNTEMITSKTGIGGSKFKSAGSKNGIPTTNVGNSRQSSVVSSKQSTTIGLNNNVTSFSSSLKIPSKIGVKSAEDSQKKHPDSIVVPEDEENMSRNILLDVPSAISMSGPHTATTAESVSCEASEQVITVDAAVNTILSYPVPKPPKDDIFSRMKKKSVEAPYPKPMVRKNDPLQPGNTLRIYKMANRDIQKKLAQQKAAREETEKAVMGLTSQNDLSDLGDIKKEESINEENIGSETKTDSEVESDVENANIPEREAEADVDPEVPKSTESKSSVCRIM